MSKHTPGPWSTDPEAENQTVLGPDGFIVADCAIFGLAVMDTRKKFLGLKPKSRVFNTRFKKKMNGEVVERN